jgi:hypothetical protein
MTQTKCQLPLWLHAIQQPVELEERCTLQDHSPSNPGPCKSAGKVVGHYGHQCKPGTRRSSLATVSVVQSRTVWEPTPLPLWDRKKILEKWHNSLRNVASKQGTQTITGYPKPWDD